MGKMLATTSITFAIAQLMFTTNAQEILSLHPNKPPRIPSTEISKATQFAPNGDSDYGSLIRYKSVQRELKLTDKQIKELDALYDSQLERNLPVLDEYRNTTRDQEKRAAIKLQLDALFQQFGREIKGKLTRDQARRLTQIRVQNAGLRAFLLPEVAQALNLAPERQDAIAEILEAVDFRARQIVGDAYKVNIREIKSFPGENWDEFRKSKAVLARYDQYRRTLAANRETAWREIFRLLTNRQEKKYKEFFNSPFDPEKHRRPDDERPAARKPDPLSLDWQVR